MASTLIVEDGTGVATADTFISSADAGTYHTAMNNTAWAGSDTVKDAALRKATAYMEQVYRLSWKGLRYTSTQALSWPRTDVFIDDKQEYVDTDEIPTEVKNACAELALKALSGELYPDLKQNATEKTVGPLTTRYDPYSPQSKRYVSIDAMLAPLLKGTAGVAKVVRV